MTTEQSNLCTQIKLTHEASRAITKAGSTQEFFTDADRQLSDAGELVRDAIHELFSQLDQAAFEAPQDIKDIIKQW